MKITDVLDTAELQDDVYLYVAQTELQEDGTYKKSFRKIPLELFRQYFALDKSLCARSFIAKYVDDDGNAHGATISPCDDITHPNGYKAALVILDGIGGSAPVVIRHLADGIEDHDAATVGQVKELRVTVTKAGGGSFTADKTFSEVKAAYDIGRSISLLYQNMVLPLYEISENDVVFTRTHTSLHFIVSINSNNVVDVNIEMLDLAQFNNSSEPLKDRYARVGTVQSMIDSSVGGIDATKLNKPKTAPEVGKILKVAAVNEDGTFTCEWADDSSPDSEKWELIEEINVDEEAVVERRYNDRYKKIAIMARNDDSKLPKIRLLGDVGYWEFYGFAADTWAILNVYGEITIPKVFSQAYTLYGGGGGNAAQAWPIMGRLTQQSEYFNGFKTDSACHVGTTIKVYGVKTA